MSNRIKKYLAECVGTMILVLVGCGTAVATGCDDTGGFVATALAFGIAIVALAYSVGRISGGHVNPAVSLAVYLNGGMDLKDLLGYIGSQIVGALVGSALLGAFFGGFQATGANGIASLTAMYNSYGNEAPETAAILSAFAVEIVLTFIFVLSILGITSKKEESSLGGLLIGLVLTGVHLVGIPLTGTSVNPARSLSAAIFAAFAGDTEPLKWIWIFILAPLVGAALAALLWKFVLCKKEKEEPKEEAKEAE